MEILEIPLTNGMVAIIDADDWPLVENLRWCAMKGHKGHAWYARATTGGRILMHRVIMGAGDGTEIDHKDGDGLNNRRSNLRFCTHSQNMQNIAYKLGKSGYRGVGWHPESKKWTARIKHGGCRVYLGLFDDVIAAAMAYDNKARELYGDFAYFNFPDEAKKEARG